MSESRFYSLKIDQAREALEESEDQLFLTKNLLFSEDDLSLCDENHLKYMLCESFCLNYTLIKEFRTVLQESDESGADQENIIFFEDKANIIEQALIARLLNTVQLNSYSVSMSFH
jgi:hypothetical protein